MGELLLSDDDLIDNAAGCAQFRPLCSDMDETDESLRECIKLNVCKPLRARIAALEAELTKANRIVGYGVKEAQQADRFRSWAEERIAALEAELAADYEDRIAALEAENARLLEVVHAARVMLCTPLHDLTTTDGKLVLLNSGDPAVAAFTRLLGQLPDLSTDEGEAVEVSDE